MLAAVALAFALPVAAQAGTVSVDLTGLRAGGTLYVQVQTREQFLGQARIAGQIVAATQPGSLSVDLGEIAPGDYAVTVWHDSNGNSQFEMGAQGQPADGWAMANRLRGAPTFEQVRLTVPATGLRVPLAVAYGH